MFSFLRRQSQPSYELMDLPQANDSDDGELQSRDSNESQASDASQIFSEIDSYTRNELLDEEERVGSDSKQSDVNFYDSAVFQQVMNRYKGTKTIFQSKLCGILTVLSIVLWVIGVLIYANQNPKQLIQKFKFHTNIISFDGRNISLNAYDRTLDNVTMDDIRRGKFYPAMVDISWLAASQIPTELTLHGTDNIKGGYYITSDHLSYSIGRIHTDLQQPFIPSLEFEYKNNFFVIQQLIVHPDAPVDDPDIWHIVATDIQPEWRHLKYAIFWLYNPMTKRVKPIQPPDVPKKEALRGVADQESQLYKLHFARFSPGGKYVAFGYNNDLYLLDIKADKITRITNDGSKDIFNAKVDWVYEEEVCGSDKQLWWSPDETHLAFLKLNDTLVEDFTLDYYIKKSEEIGGDTDSPMDNVDTKINQYPVKLNYKYPKVGSHNPLPSVQVFDTTKMELSTMPDSKIKNQLGEDYILYSASWVGNDTMVLKLTDRTSKILQKSAFQVKDNKVSEISKLDVFSEYNGWVSKTPPITLIASKMQYIDRVVVNGQTQLGLFKDVLSSDYQLLTSSNEWNIVEGAPVVYDEIENFVYTLITIRSSMDSHFVGIDLLNENRLVPLTNTTIDGKYEIHFSHDGQYVNLQYKGPDVPWQKLVNMQDVHTLFKDDDQINSYADIFSKLPTINPSALDIQKSISTTNIPTRTFSTVKLDKITLNVLEILPPNFDPSKKHPLFVHAYGGPGSQTVDKSFSIEFLDVVSSALDAVVLVIDPRGTGGKSWSFKSYATNSLGLWEPQDLVTVVSEYISVNKVYINEKRVALWGWSYGGFVTLKTLEFDQGATFKYGMAVAPVTNWLFYDSIYTERYMGMPDTNKMYSTSARINNFDSFKKIQRFLIMHGTSDDNVHLQNLLWLLDNFDTAQVENYDVHFFPDSDHSIYFHNADVAVYDKLMHWLSDAFKGRFDSGFV